MANQIELISSSGRSLATGMQVPKAFLDFGVRGVKAYAYSVGLEIANQQERMGNSISGFYVDGYKNRNPEQMKRNLVWEFSKSDLIIKAIKEGLDLAKSLSTSLAREPSGGMASSWHLYINGVETNVDSVDGAKLKVSDDIRITSDKEYARYLESGKWAGTRNLSRRFKKAKARMERKRYRGAINVTKTIATRLKKKYKSIVVTDKWYEDGKSPVSFSFGKDRRWPAVLFGFRRER